MIVTYLQDDTLLTQVSREEPRVSRLAHLKSGSLVSQSLHAPLPIYIWLIPVIDLNLLCPKSNFLDPLAFHILLPLEIGLILAKALSHGPVCHSLVTRLEQFCISSDLRTPASFVSVANPPMIFQANNTRTSSILETSFCWNIWNFYESRTTATSLWLQPARH